MLWVVVPAYNEEQKIGRVIRGLFEHGFNNVIVVDDGSRDATAATAEAAGAVVLRHCLNRGQGAALETGDRYALLHGAEFVIHFDADGQFNPADITPALSFLKEKNLDVVLGSRFLDKRSRIPWFKRLFVLPVARWINFVFTGFLLTDVHNGFRILSQKALKAITITHDRMAHNTEIVQQINRQGLAFKEFPVEVLYEEFGQGIGGGFKIMHDLFIGLILR